VAYPSDYKFPNAIAGLSNGQTGRLDKARPLQDATSRRFEEQAGDFVGLEICLERRTFWLLFRP
jgi:hypothetical protein